MRKKIVDSHRGVEEEGKTIWEIVLRGGESLPRTNSLLPRVKDNNREIIHIAG